MESIDLSTIYTYSQLEAGEIRLLHVTSADGALRCALRHVSLEQCPSYIALSYCWEGQIPDQELICDGLSLKVTANVKAVLHYILESEQDCLVWIDAVCINQNHIAEKNFQVPMMDQIYTKAVKCVAWLGTSSDSLDKMIDSLPEMLQTARTYTGPYNGNIPDKVFTDHGIPTRPPSVWLEFASLLSRPWFQRVWVIQEAILPSILHIVCGNRIVDMNALTSLVGDYRIATVICIMASTGRRPIPYSVRCALDCWYTISYLKARWQAGQNSSIAFSLPRLVFAAQEFSASNPIDKVNGMLGIADKRWKEHLVVDYASSAAIAYIQVTKAWLSSGQDLFALNLAASSAPLNGLPRWCPNYNETTSTNSLGTCGLNLKYHAGFRKWPDMEHFHMKDRGIGMSQRDYYPAIEDHGPCFIADSALLTIEVLGFRFDRIARSIPPTWNFKWSSKSDNIIDLEQFLAWEAQCLSLSQNTSRTPNEVPECHWRTLIANKLELEREARKCDVDCSELYKSGVNLLKEIVQRSKNVSATKNSERVGKIEEFYQAMESWEIPQFWNSVNLACLGRSFFSTESGRTGLGPPDTEPGDTVCIFYNGRTPFIVRPIDTDGIGNEYQFLGESYVDGLMYGEAFELDASNESTMFTLH